MPAYYLDADAPNQWCPFVRIPWDGGPVNRPGIGQTSGGLTLIDPAMQFRCIGSQCMAWRWLLDSSQAPTQYGYCGLAGNSVGSPTPPPPPPTPPVWSRADVTVVGATTSVVIPGVAGQVIKVVRYLLDAGGTGNASFDVQDTSGKTLSGGPVSMTSSTPVSFNYGSTEEILRNPIFQTGPGLGLQFVTTGNATLSGFIDYQQAAP
jgi:hypothetical protein